MSTAAVLFYVAVIIQFCCSPWSWCEEAHCIVPLPNTRLLLDSCIIWFSCSKAVLIVLSQPVQFWTLCLLFEASLIAQILGKESACNVRDPDSIPGSGILSPREGIRYPLQYSGFAGSSDSKESACNLGDLSSIPGLAAHSSILAWRILRGRGPWWATFHGVTKSQIRLSD